MPPMRLVLIAAFLGSTVLAQEPAKNPSKDKYEVLPHPVEESRDQTLLRRVTENTYVHEAARVSFTVPDGWKEIRPHRLNRKIDPRISSVLGIERADREIVASIYWMPMTPDQRLSHWVRETPAGNPPEYGEEYETLKTVYGKDHVTAPVRFRSGSFDVFRINITGGPDPADKYDGVLFVFAVESGGTTWLVKARVSFPKGGRAQTDAWAMDVLNAFKQVPDSGAKR